jgi:hypothetical protein
MLKQECVEFVNITSKPEFDFKLCPTIMTTFDKMMATVNNEQLQGP